MNRYERVYVEDLRIEDMRWNRKLSKSIGDAGWGILRSALTYMAQRSLGVIALVNPMNRSQVCSGCGELAPKPLSERTHHLGPYIHTICSFSTGICKPTPFSPKVIYQREPAQPAHGTPHRRR